jgi:hypothetical protein
MCFHIRKLPVFVVVTLGLLVTRHYAGTSTERIFEHRRQ